MASVVNDPNNRKRVAFTGSDGKRRSLRVGKMARRDAEYIAARVESILSASAAGMPLDRVTADWLAATPIYAKLAAVGLVNPRETDAEHAGPTLAKFLDSYIAKRVDAKASSRLVFGRARKHLVEYFEANRELSDITEGAAEDFALHLAGKNMAEATIRKMCGVARQFFKSAVKHRLIAANPFDAEGIKTTVKGNSARFRFITADEADAVLNACPDAQWRLIFALSRWGGLRCPSEHLALRWEHVDWENNRLIVPQPKVAHHGTPERIVPLFPELRLHLESAFDEAEPGTVEVITRYRKATANLRTQFERIIRRAGLTPWPRLFHNLRATRQTELSDRFPQHVVCQWLGNSEQVAERHYLNTTDDHFRAALNPSEKAARFPARLVRESACLGAHGETGNEKTPCCQGVLVAGMDDTGLEPVTSTMST